jgi:hypothetical protein
MDGVVPGLQIRDSFAQERWRCTAFQLADGPVEILFAHHSSVHHRARCRRPMPLLVHEPPLVRVHHDASIINELNAHRHADGLVRGEQDD